MERRRLPGTALDLSLVGTGCWAMGGLWWGDDVRDEDSVAALKYAIDCGINWVDTAPLYGHGHADALLVRAFGRGVAGLIVATKTGVRWDGEGAHARSDLRAHQIQADVEASLRRLGREQIELLQVHWPCERGTPLEETMAALEQLRSSGKVGYIGLCNYSATGLREAARHGHIDVLQTPYSMLRREFERELAPLVRQLDAGDGARQLGVLAYEPLCRGLLTGKFEATARFADSDLRQRDDRFGGARFLRALTVVSRLQLLAKRRGLPVAAVALGWVLRQPGVTAAIAGAKRPDQIGEHARVTEALADATLWPEVERIVAAFRG